MTRPTRDKWAMSLAQLTARRSTCCRREVGCVLLNKRGHVLATGYNGVAAKLPHCNKSIMVQNPLKVGEKWDVIEKELFPYACEGAQSQSGADLDACQAIHAEQNALLQCKDVYDIHTCYVTSSPCITCTKLLLNTSCQNIIFLDEYPHNNAKLLWVSAGRKWRNIND